MDRECEKRAERGGGAGLEVINICREKLSFS